VVPIDGLFLTMIRPMWRKKEKGTEKIKKKTKNEEEKMNE
jgi:hypothetical protein